jgi:hypothetical protein
MFVREERTKSRLSLQLRIRSERDADGDSGTVRISAVEQVVSVTLVIDINVVCLIPVVAPIVGVRIHHREPVAAVLETRIAALIHEGKAIDAEVVTSTVVAAEIIVGNSVAMVAAALLPAAVIVIPVI